MYDVLVGAFCLNAIFWLVGVLFVFIFVSPSDTFMPIFFLFLLVVFLLVLLDLVIANSVVRTVGILVYVTVVVFFLSPQYPCNMGARSFVRL